MVTVILTNWNYGVFLYQAIQSIVAQTTKPEVVLIDDASTDNSWQVLRSSPWKPIIHGTRQGLVKTLNEAMGYVKTPYVIRLDADDYFEPDALEKMKSEMDNGWDIVYPQVIWEGDIQGKSEYPEFKKAELEKKNFIPGCSMFNIKVWKKIKFRERLHEDYDFWLRASKNNFDFKLYNKHLVHVRYHFEMGHRHNNTDKIRL